MAQTYTENGGGAPDGSKTTFTYSFETIEETNTTSQTNSEVKVALNGVTQNTNKYYVQKSTSSIQFHNTNGVDSTVQAASGAPLNGVKVRVYRDTKVSSPTDKRHTFQAGSAIKASALNDIYEHALFALDEEREQTVFSEDIEDGAVIRSKIGADSVDGTKIADDSLDSEHYVDGSVDLAHLSANSVDSSKIVDGSIVNSDINATAGIEISKFEDVNSAKIIVGNGSNRPTAVDMSGDVTIDNAGATTITADAVQIGNISDTETTLTANSDAKIPTSKAVADHVVDVVNSVGGFVIVPDKDNFPTSNPDPNNDSGTVLSITNPNGLTVSSGTSSNGTRTGVSDTVTITGIPTDAGSTLSANYTMLVQTTTTAHTYTFYKFLAKDGDVLTLSNDINDFAARYRVAASAPITGLCDATGANTGSYPCDGDMYWNTGTNKMYVFGAPAASTSTTDLQAAWAEVTSTGEFKELTVVDNGATSGTPTFGSATQFDLRDAGNSASVINKNQLIVVLNGVVQKSNAGTYSTSEEGFYLDGVDGIRFCTAPPANSTIFVTLIGSAVSIPTPGDETVDEGKLNANAPTNDHVLTADDTATGGFKWAAIDTTPEGTAVKSTGESGGSKYLREDGDGTCSWQSVPAGVGGANGVQFNDTVTATWGTGNDLSISHTGPNSTISHNDSSGSLRIHGNGLLSLGYNSGNNNQLQLNGSGVTTKTAFIAPTGNFKLSNTAETYKITLQADGSLGADYTITLPTAAPTSNGLALTATTAGVASWTSVSSTVANGAIYINDDEITDDYTIAAGKGAHSVGPITLTGATVTVNGRWVIS